MRIEPTVLEVVNGNLIPLAGEARDFTHHMSTIGFVYREDGSREEIEVAPYPVKMNLDPFKVQQLVRTGIWTQDDLTPYGFVATQVFDSVPDEGKQFDPTTKRLKIQEDNTVVWEFDQIDIPPPPEPPTPAEQVDRLLNDYGLTKEQLLEVLQTNETPEG